MPGISLSVRICLNCLFRSIVEPVFAPGEPVLWLGGDAMMAVGLGEGLSRQNDYL